MSIVPIKKNNIHITENFSSHLTQNYMKQQTFFHDYGVGPMEKVNQLMMV